MTLCTLLRRGLAIAAATVLTAGLTSCGQPASGPAASAVEVPPGAVLVRGAGATFPAPLYEAWFAAYMAEHPETVVTYDAVGSGEGTDRFIGIGIPEEKQVDFGASDAAMNDEEIGKVERGVQLLPVTGGSVVLAYNLPDFDGELRLSREAYSGIFLGEITSWDDPRITKHNPTLHSGNLSIVTAVRRDSSGTTFALTKHLDAVNPTWRKRFGATKYVDWPGAAMTARGNEGVAGLIQQSVGSLGYVEFGFARRLGLPMAWLENRAGRFVRPSEFSGGATLAAMDIPDNLRAFAADPAGEYAYPIVTLSWILLYKTYDEAAKSAAIKDLFHWCLRQGQLYSTDLGYIPLAPSLAARARAALDTITP